MAALFGENPPWRSKTVAVAAGVMLVGLGFWLKDRHRLEADPAQVSALFRFGASYLGGYFIGWAFRRGLKALLITSGIILGGIALMKATGWVDLQWDSIQHNIASSFDWLRGEATEWKKMLSGYLPSVGIAVVGMFFGARRKPR